MLLRVEVINISCLESVTFSRLFLEAVFCFDNRYMEVFSNQTEDEIRHDPEVKHQLLYADAEQRIIDVFVWLLTNSKDRNVDKPN